MEATEVTTPMFINPHLFWIFEVKDNPKRYELEQELIQKYQGKVFEFEDEKYTLGEMVAVKYKNVWARGTIEEVREDFSPKYDIWLIDYGYLLETNTVFKLPMTFRKIPNLVKQASLMDIVYIIKRLDLETQTELSQHTLEPTPGARHVIQELIQDKRLFFQTVKNDGGISYGDILINNDHGLESLTKLLVLKNVMGYDEKLFKNVEDTRMSVRTTSAEAIKQFFKANSSDSPSMKMKKGRNNISFDSSDMDETFSMRASRTFSNVTYKNGDSPISDSQSIELLRKKKLGVAPNLQEKWSDTNTESEMDDSFKKLSPKKSKKDSDEESVSSGVSKISLLKKRAAFLKKQKENITTSSSEPQNNATGWDLASDTDSSQKGSPNITTKPLQQGNTIPKKKPNMPQFIPAGYENNEQFLAKKRNEIKNLAKTNQHYTKKMQPNQSPSSDLNSSLCSSNSRNMNNKRQKTARIVSKNRDSFESDSSKSVIETKISKTVSKSESENVTSENEQTRKGPASNVNMVIKPFCKCAKCDFWTKSDGWATQETMCNGENKKVLIKRQKPNSLLRNKSLQRLINIIGIDFKKMTRIEKQSACKILVHGTNIPRGVDYLAEANFNVGLHDAMIKLGYARAKKLQTYVWPAITRNANVCYIGDHDTGKTMGYMPAICSFMMDRHERYKDLSKHRGPIAVILCRNSLKCEYVYDLMHKILPLNNKKAKVLLETYPVSFMHLSSMDVLITLPAVLLDLIKHNAVNLKRLCHLVIEDINVILDKNKADIDKILAATESMLEDRIVKKDVQIILSGDHWTLNIENLVKDLNNVPLICIGNFLEAVIYGRIDFRLKCMASNMKISNLVSILREKSSFMRTVVVCTNEEMKEIVNSLQINGIGYMALFEDMKTENIAEDECIWQTTKDGEHRVLLCSDYTLSTMLSITTASLLIHFSLPHSWSKLKYRFVCLLERCKSPIVKTKDKLVSEAYVFTDETNEAQIPRLLNLLKNYGVPLKQYDEYFQNLHLQEEELKAKKGVPLCKRVKLLGECDKKSCQKRHKVYKEFDSQGPIPANGQIKFKITDIKYVSHFLGELVQHIDFDGKVTTYGGVEKFYSKQVLSKLLGPALAQITPREILEGQMYAFKDPAEFDDVFRQCKVLQNCANFIVLKLLDDESIVKTSPNHLFNLPEQEDKKSSVQIEIVLADLKPPYKDETYSNKSFFKIKSLLENIDYSTSSIVADIYLSSGNIVWVKNVFQEVQLPDINVCKQQISKDIIKLKLAEENPKHMQKLYKMFEEAEIPLAVYDRPKPKITSQKQMKPQWAHLDREEINRVIFSNAVSPDEFYVRLEKNNDLLDKLERDIDDLVQNHTSAAHLDNLDISEGKVYIAQEPQDGVYSRVIVRKIEDACALCFAVDYGDEYVVETKLLKFLPNNLIFRLPFQAILCRLHGIREIDNEWSDEATNILYDNYTEPNSDIFRLWYLKTVQVTPGETRGQNKYSVLLKDGYDPKHLMINKLILDCGLGEEHPDETIDDFDVPKSLEEEEIDEDMIEIYEDIKNDLQPSHEMDIGNYVSVDMENMTPEQHVKHIEENFELVMYDAAEFSKALWQSITFDPVEPTKSNQIEESEKNLPAITAGPKGDTLSPEIIWSQTDKEIKLHIKIPDIKDYQLSILKTRILKFKTTVNEKTYGVNLILFDNVLRKTKQKLLGPHLEVTLTKEEEAEWPRLPIHLKKCRNIHYDLTQLNLEEEKHRRFLDLGIPDEGPYSDEENDPMVHVCSDMDSEFDQDLETDSDD